MTTPKSPQPRRLDGPRQPTKSPAQAAAPSDQNPEATPEPPVFSYHKVGVSRRRLAIWQKLLLGLVALALVSGVFFGVKVILATNRIITRNNTAGAPALTSSHIDPTKLAHEGDGRINILILGIGGAGHQGGSLSDTMLVVSIDPNSKSASILSIPRDLWVPIPGHGYAKINAANSYGGPDLAKTVVASTLDIPIHYYVQLDFTGFREAVDEVGGIDVINQFPLSDSNYPCDDADHNVCPYYLAAGSYHLDGTAALKYVRCREGTCGTNYGREDRQRQSLLALRQKVLTISTLTNPAKIASLIDIVGGHLKTDLQLSDMSKLISIGQQIDSKDVTTAGLGDYTITGSAGGQSVVLSKTGTLASIQAYVHTLLADSYLVGEKAAVEVDNASGQTSLGASVTALLQSYRYNVIGTLTAAKTSKTNLIYDYSGGKKPYTLKYLEARFGVVAQTAARPVGDKADIRVVVGSNYAPL